MNLKGALGEREPWDPCTPCGTKTYLMSQILLQVTHSTFEIMPVCDFAINQQCKRSTELATHPRLHRYHRLILWAGLGSYSPTTKATIVQVCQQELIIRSGSVSSPLFSSSVLTLVDSPSSPLTDHINICGAKDGKIPWDNPEGGETLILPLRLKAATAETSALKPRNTRDDSKIRGH